ATGVVGKGIRPAASGGKNDMKRFKTAWKEWAEKVACDHAKRLNLYGLQKLVMRAVAESGECLILKRINPNSKYRLELMVLEGDYIDHNQHHAYGMTNPDGSFDHYGIRYDRDYRRVGIWVYEKHPMEGGFKSNLVPMSDVIHVFEVLRAGQSRGVPMGVASFVRMNDFAKYEDAQLLRQQVAACFSVFVRQGTGIGTGAAAGAYDDRYEKIEPASIQYLAPGEEVTFGNPPVTEGYESYSRWQLRAIAAAYRVSYEALTGDYSNANFASGRMGWIQMQQSFDAQQRDVLIPALDQIAEWFTGVLLIQGVLRAEVLVEWTTPRREMLDPTKETDSLVAQVQSGLKSYAEAVRELGYEWADTLDEIKEVQTVIDEKKLTISADYRTQMKPQTATNQSPPPDKKA
ncbi:MAG: phage portal protein, partial [Betaproteobacteria bacterium]